MKIIEEEEEREEERNQKLGLIQDPEKREKLDHEYGILRAHASERIKKLAKKHDKNVAALQKKLKAES